MDLFTLRIEFVPIKCSLQDKVIKHGRPISIDYVTTDPVNRPTIRRPSLFILCQYSDRTSGNIVCPERPLNNGQWLDSNAVGQLIPRVLGSLPPRAVSGWLDPLKDLIQDSVIFKWLAFLK